MVDANRASIGGTSLRTDTKPVGHQMRYMVAAVLISLLFWCPSTTRASDLKPLSVADMSSPRATLQSFLETSDDILVRWAALLKSLRDSGRLFPTPEERETMRGILQIAPKAIRALNVSQIPPVLRDTISAERALQLRDILDRIALPALADVPDQTAMAGRTPKRWRLPDTQIDFVRIEDGPRAGDYLISAETVA